MKPAAVELDGAMGEGGGQIVRTAVTLSALFGEPVRIVNVRAGRARPGLQPQHLAAVRAAADICGARLSGADRGSTVLRFEPTAPVRPGGYRIDIGTAGAATLVAQTLLLPLAMAAGASTVVVTGGTHVPHAPPVEYLADVYARAMAAVGISVAVGCGGLGFYPRGGGEVRLELDGGAVPAPVEWVDRGRLLSVRAHVVAANLPGHVAARGVEAVRAGLRGVECRPEIAVDTGMSPGPGAAVVVSAECERGAAGFTSIGERGVPMERVAGEACRGLQEWLASEAACDAHLADQLVLPASVARGESCWSTPVVTAHLRTVLAVAERMAGVRWTIDERPGGSAIVRVGGGGPPANQ